MNISVKERGNWSGGGHSLLENIAFARRRHPDFFNDEGVPLYLRNVVDGKDLLNGGYIYLPQNAWAWHGPTGSTYEFRKRALLRAISEVALARACRTIRIGPMIPSRSGDENILANVLDESFESTLNSSKSISRPEWLPKNKFFFVPGSMWGYRNLGVVVEAFNEYVANGGTASLVLVGSFDSRSGARGVLESCFDNSSIYCVVKHISRVELLYGLEKCEACILSSIVEASPVTLLEAAAVGAPICAWNNEAYKYLARKNQMSEVSYVSNKSDLLEYFFQPKNRTDYSIGKSQIREEMREKWVNSFVDLCNG